MKKKTVKENREFKRIYNRGKYIVSPELVTYVMKNRTNNIRYGITASKKIGNAVKRNRARRIIRESYYEIYEYIKNGYDIIFVARSKTTDLKSTDIKEVMMSHLKKAGAVLL